MSYGSGNNPEEDKKQGGTEIVSNLQAQIPDVLSHIRKEKTRHVASCKGFVSEASLDMKIREQEPPRGFLNALRAHEARGRFGLIAELKKASPSEGLIRSDFNPVKIARAYEAAGASCLSVLTDKPFFQGQDNYLQQVKVNSSLPCLRKDFIIDPYQIIESRALGADCVLLIMALLDDALATELEATALEVGMDVLIEIHDRTELERALNVLNSELIGINNRNLRRLTTDLTITENLSHLVPEDKLLVSESGLMTHGDLQRLSLVGVRSFLIGEALMRHENIETATQKILGST